MTPKTPADGLQEARYFRLSERKPLSCNPSDTKYNVLYKGKPVSHPNSATWDKDEQKFCFGWDGYLDKNPKHIEWRLYQEEARHAAPAERQAAGEGVEEYKPGTWFHANTIDEMEAFYKSRLPAIRAAAKDCGYAIAVHGSMRRDFDLIAMPWRSGAESRDVLAKAIQNAACGMATKTYEWEQKPAGRYATAFPVCWCEWQGMTSAGHIDLSVIEARTQGAAVDVPGAFSFDRYKDGRLMAEGVTVTGESLEHATKKAVNLCKHDTPYCVLVYRDHLPAPSKESTVSPIVSSALRSGNAEIINTASGDAVDPSPSIEKGEYIPRECPSCKKKGCECVTMSDEQKGGSE